MSCPGRAISGPPLGAVASILFAATLQQLGDGRRRGQARGGDATAGGPGAKGGIRGADWACVSRGPCLGTWKTSLWHQDGLAMSLAGGACGTVRRREETRGVWWQRGD